MHNKIEVSTLSWHVRFTCGRELHGRQAGSFSDIKKRRDILDLWVETEAGKVYAERKSGSLGFDFYVHIAMEERGVVEKHFKLITLYKDKAVVKHVQRNGKVVVKTEWLQKTTT